MVELSHRLPIPDEISIVVSKYGNRFPQFLIISLKYRFFPHHYISIHFSCNNTSTRMGCWWNEGGASPEMQKVGDTGDISLLFFLAGANFWAILGHYLDYFLVLIFLAQNVSLLFLLLFASLNLTFSYIVWCNLKSYNCHIALPYLTLVFGIFDKSFFYLRT